MSFYLGHHADDTSVQTVSLKVKDKGLALIRAKPCEVSVLVIPFARQPGYVNYSFHLPAFMKATATKKVQLVNLPGYPVDSWKPLLPWKMPSLIYDYERNPTDAKVEELRTHSDIVKGRGKKLSFILRDTNPTTIAKVAATGANSKTPHVINTVNLDAMKIIVLLRRILTVFLYTHQYPAFRHEDDMEPTFTDDLATDRATKKRKVEAYLANIDQIGELEEADAIMETDEEGKPAAKSTHITLTRAKPTIYDTDYVPWGDVSKVPNTSGLFVPFVNELAVGETVTLTDLISDRFLLCLGDTIPVCLSTFDQLKSAWGVICNTDLGHEITHLAKCITIALKAQATAFPIYTESVYEGCVICGTGYVVSVNKRSLYPVAYDDLQKVVKRGAAHSRAIYEIMSALGMDESDTTISNMKSIRELAKYLKARELDETTRSEIMKAALCLSYPDKYWATNSVNVERALDLLGDPDSDIPLDVPMHPDYMFTMSRTESVLCAFGHQAFSFMIPNGPKCDLKKMADPPKNFHTRTVMLSKAISDMEYVLENGYITNNVNSLSAKHKDNALKGKPKVDIWRKLRNLYETQDTDDVAADDDSSVGGTPNQRYKLALDQWE